MHLGLAKLREPPLTHAIYNTYLSLTLRAGRAPLVPINFVTASRCFGRLRFFKDTVAEEKDSISIGRRGGRDGVYILGKLRHRTGPRMGIRACTKFMLQLGGPSGSSRWQRQRHRPQVCSLAGLLCLGLHSIANSRRCIFWL